MTEPVIKLPVSGNNLPCPQMRDCDGNLICKSASKEHIRTIVTMLNNYGRMREALGATIQGKSLRDYLHEQFPATIGHVPLQEYLAALEQAQIKEGE